MAKITLYNDRPSSVTNVPNIFIDKYMVQANGDYVKIFLYLLRCMNAADANGSHCFSISNMADYFDFTEKDITRALKYWEKMNLLRLEYNSKKELSGICMLSSESDSAGNQEMPVTQAAPAELPAEPEKKSKKASSDQLRRFRAREEIQELLFVIEHYLSRPLTPTDLDMLFSWYDQYKLSAEMIEFLVENCIAKGHSSLYYMNRIAQDWSMHEIRTVEQARKSLDQHTSTYHAVMKAFGIRGRNLISTETDFLQKWSNTYGFEDDMIALACVKTIQAIHEPRFEYADKILTNWFHKNIRHIKDVEQEDISFREKRKNNTAQNAHDSTSKSGNPGTSTRFSNFDQREYDYADLERQLVEQSLH